MLTRRFCVSSYHGIDGNEVYGAAAVYVLMISSRVIRSTSILLLWFHQYRKVDSIGRERKMRVYKSCGQFRNSCDLCTLCMSYSPRKTTRKTTLVTYQFTIHPGRLYVCPAKFLSTDHPISLHQGDPWSWEHARQESTQRVGNYPFWSVPTFTGRRPIYEITFLPNKLFSFSGAIIAFRCCCRVQGWKRAALRFLELQLELRLGSIFIFPYKHLDPSKTPIHLKTQNSTLPEVRQATRSKISQLSSPPQLFSFFLSPNKSHNRLVCFSFFLSPNVNPQPSWFVFLFSFPQTHDRLDLLFLFPYRISLFWLEFFIFFVNFPPAYHPKFTATVQYTFLRGFFSLMSAPSRHENIACSKI